MNLNESQYKKFLLKAVAQEVLLRIYSFHKNKQCEAFFSILIHNLHIFFDESLFHILGLCIDWGCSFILLTFEISLCIWIQVFYQICGFQRFFLQKKASISKLLPVVFFLKQSFAFGTALFINLLFYSS